MFTLEMHPTQTERAFCSDCYKTVGVHFDFSTFYIFDFRELYSNHRPLLECNQQLAVNSRASVYCDFLYVNYILYFIHYPNKITCVIHNL